MHAAAFFMDVYNRKIMAKRQMRLEEIAAEVGRLFGTTEAHAQKWLGQRTVLLEALGTVHDKANALMAELDGVPSPFGQKRGRPAKRMTASPLTDTPRKVRGRRKMSEETKAKMRAAAQKRWAEHRKASGGTKRGSLTPLRTTGTKPTMK
jgi:hypothetical protein